VLEALEGKRTIKETTSALEQTAGKLFWQARGSVVRPCGTRREHPRRIAKRDWRDGRGFGVRNSKFPELRIPNL
jgi:hypothetical protein